MLALCPCQDPVRLVARVRLGARQARAPRRRARSIAGPRPRPPGRPIGSRDRPGAWTVAGPPEDLVDRSGVDTRRFLGVRAVARVARRAPATTQPVVPASAKNARTSGSTIGIWRRPERAIEGRAREDRGSRPPPARRGRGSGRPVRAAAAARQRASHASRSTLSSRSSSSWSAAVDSAAGGRTRIGSPSRTTPSRKHPRVHPRIVGVEEDRDPAGLAADEHVLDHVARVGRRRDLEQQLVADRRAAPRPAGGRARCRRSSGSRRPRPARSRGRPPGPARSPRGRGGRPPDAGRRGRGRGGGRRHRGPAARRAPAPRGSFGTPPADTLTWTTRPASGVIAAASGPARWQPAR